MMHVIYCDDLESPIKSVFAGTIYGDTYAASQLTSLVRTTRGEPMGDTVYYSRYWHGYRIWLKPLLVFFNYTQIRLFNTYTFYILLFGCCLYLSKKINWQISFALLISMIMINITIIPMNMLFTCVFVISFIAIILASEMIRKKPDRIGLLFFAIGSVTMFFDFYTYPFLSMGLPLTAVIAYLIQKEWSIKKIIKISALCMGTWVLGYLMTWIVNVLFSTLLLGNEDLKATMSVIYYRLDKSEKIMSPALSVKHYFIQGYRAVRDSLRELFATPHGEIFMAFSSVWLVLFILFKKKWNDLKMSLSFVAVLFFPIIWYLIASKPTRHHLYFQYRGVILWIFILIYILLTSIDYNKIKAKFKSKKIKDQ